MSFLRDPFQEIWSKYTAKGTGGVPFLQMPLLGAGGEGEEGGEGGEGREGEGREGREGRREPQKTTNTALLRA